MSWNQFHSESERIAAQAEIERRAGRRETAEELYCRAAQAETEALKHVPREKSRTLGITGVSAVALWYKGRDYAEASRLAYSLLAEGTVPPFAEAQLRDLLSMLWSAQTAEKAGVRFVPGDVLVSVQGGLVAHGGAPLDLIQQKQESVKAMLYRTAEMLNGRPVRKRGGPPLDILETYRPWLFQAPAASYAFAVRIQEPPQLEMWPGDRQRAETVTEKFFTALQASAASDPDEALPSVIPDAEYRTVFLKLVRNLAPSKGTTFERLSVRDAGSPGEAAVSFGADNRQEINAALKRLKPAAILAQGDTPVTLGGVLVGVHLAKDWLEIAPDQPELSAPGGLIHVDQLAEVLDDVVGPMVNRRVIVTAVRRGQKYVLRDIELDE